jgi:hypothetical protein
LEKGEMMAQAGDLIVVDEEFSGRGDELASHRDFFCHVLMEYRDIMDYLTANLEGKTSRAIVDLTNQIRDIPGEILGVGKDFEIDCDFFVGKTDIADSFVY